MSKFTCVLTGSILALSCTQVGAQNNINSDQLEEIVVTGQTAIFGSTKSKIPVTETPRSISIITDEDFIEKGALSLGNTLSYTAGVTGDAFGFATRGDFVSIRGLDAPEYQDNLQVLFGFYNNARADIFTLEQVEVLKGPASVLYGQAAPGGIVSTVSKVASSDNLDNEVTVSFGNFDRKQVSLDSGFKLNESGSWTARLVALYRDSETQVDFLDDNATVFAPSVTYENESTTISALVNVTDRESGTAGQFIPLSVSACGNSSVTISEANVCAFSSGAEVDSSTFVGDPNFDVYNTEATTISLFATHQFNDVLSFEGTARYRDNEADYNQSWISFLGDGNPRTFPDGTAVIRTWYSVPAGSDQAALDARLRASFDTGAINHEVLFGVNYQDVETYVDQSFLYGVPTTFNIFNPVYDGSEIPSSDVFEENRFLSEDKTVATDFYLTDHLTIGDLVVSAGIRQSSVDSEDAFNNQKDSETPITLGLLYKTASGFNPYISYAESFRATIGTDVETGTPLLPRRGIQTEVGFKYLMGDNASYITASYFDLEEDNLVEFVAEGSTQPGLSIDTQGFEIEAKLNFNDFAIDFDYRNLDAVNIDSVGAETVRPSLPDTTASLWTTWEPSTGSLEGFRVGAGVRYASENESNGTAFLFANDFAPTDVQVVTDGYSVIDALLGYRFDKYDFTLNVRNLADEEYYSTCLSRGDCFFGERRTIVGSVKMTF